jgi:DNA-binding transcriptional ArsR family regulator
MRGSEPELLVLLTAMGHPQRLRIIAELTTGRVRVSALARRLGLSRPLLHLHIDRLRTVGLVSSHTERSDDGTTRHYVQLAPFELNLTAAAVRAALGGDDMAGEAPDMSDEKEAEL